MWLLVCCRFETVTNDSTCASTSSTDNSCFSLAVTLSCYPLSGTSKPTLFTPSQLNSLSNDLNDIAVLIYTQTAPLRLLLI